MPGASATPGLFKVFSFKSRIVGLSLITMDTRQIESRICARDLVFKCLRKSGRISCRESGKERAALRDFFRQKFVEMVCAAGLSAEIWLLVPRGFRHNLTCVFCSVNAPVWSVKWTLGLILWQKSLPSLKWILHVRLWLLNAGSWLQPETLLFRLLAVKEIGAAAGCLLCLSRCRGRRGWWRKKERICKYFLSSGGGTIYPGYFPAAFGSVTFA